MTLAKYLEEIVAAVVEGASKGKGDPEAAVDVSTSSHDRICRSQPSSHNQIIVQLHSRLAPDFLPLLLPPLLAVLNQGPTQASGKDEKDRDREEKERMSRQRPVLRIVAELAMVGAWAEGAARGGLEVQKVLKSLVCRSLISIPAVC